MATAVRVNSSRERAEGVTFAGLGIGPFGNRVIELMAEYTSMPHIARNVEPLFQSRPRAVVMALWRPAPALCEQADEQAFRTGVPWLPVIMEHPMIRVGPLVVPSSGACWRCYQARRAQYDEQYEATEALYAAYDRDPDRGPAGFLPHHARAAAGVATSLLERAAEGSPEAVARVVTISTTNAGLSAGHVLGVHGCERCREPAPPRDLHRLFRTRSMVNAHEH